MQPETVSSWESVEPEDPFLQSRYPGSLPFQDHPLHRLLFFGRETEAEALLHKILAEDLVVFYARSGLGKTSLLNAAILPRLRERGYFPLMCRVYAPWQNGPSHDSLMLDPLTSVYGFIEQEIDKGLSNGVLTDHRAGKKTTLWEYFKTVELWAANDILLTPVLILDQFEELFTFYSQEQRQAFAKEFADLLRGSIPKALRDKYRGRNSSSKRAFPYTEAPPKVKALISMWEEYLGHLAELAQELPSIRKSEFRITPLQRENAERAIVDPAMKEDKQLMASAALTPVFSYAPETLREILDFLCNPGESGVENNEVDPSQLQLLCQHIEEKVRERVSLHPGEKVIVDRSILHGRDEMRALIQGFYERVIAKIPDFQRRNVINLFENDQHGLISPTGRRLSLAQEIIESHFHVSEDMLKELQEKRLLRSEHRLGEFYYELSHDTLIKPIQKSKQKRAEKKARVRRWISLIGFSFLAAIIGAYSYYSMDWIKMAVGSPQYKISYYEKRGDQNCKDGDFTAAQEDFEKAVRLAKENKDQNLSGLYLKLADSYLHLGDHDEAISNYWKAVIRLNEEQKGPAYYGLGNAYSAQGNFKKAIGPYEKAERLDPKNLNLLNLAFAYLKEGEREKALQIISRLNEIMKGSREFQRGMEAGYNNLIKGGGGGFAILRDGLGQVYIIEWKFAQAKNEFEKAVEIAQKGNDPNLPRYYLNLGESYLALRQYEQAISSYQAGLKFGLKDPDLGKAYFGLGNAYSAQKKYREAIEPYEKAVNSDPGNAYAFIYLGVAYREEGQPQKACESLDKAREISRLNPGVTSDPQFKEAMQKLEELCKVPGNSIKGPTGTN